MFSGHQYYTRGMGVYDVTSTHYSTIFLILLWYFVKRHFFKYSQVCMLFPFYATHGLFILHVSFILCNIFW